MSYPSIRLQKNQERRILAGHHWIYSNEIDSKFSPLKSLTPGDLVFVENYQGKPLGIAYINPNTLLCARILTRDSKEKIDTDFFMMRIQQALTWREKMFDKPFYRLIFSESDGLPGLIIDRFNDTLVGQINTAGMQKLMDHIVVALQRVINPKHILWRNDTAYREVEGLPQEVVGEAPDICIVEENNCVFHGPIRHGQKTGWFYDHRFSRERLTHYVKNKTVLDVFSYLGAFAIPQAKAGATHVTCIDISEKATLSILENAKLNQVENKVSCITDDAFNALEKLKAENKKFDVIILDPPAFIKRKKDQEKGLIAYLQINQLAMQLLNENGILLSASCSMHLSRDELLNTIRRAGLKTQKTVRILEQLHQAPDHPIHPSIEETNYLKGFICSV